MSDDEREKFEITDYDIENEFNINRKRKGNSKHQQIYGIWADDSDEENDNNYKNKPTKAKQAYTAPIGFVAGGVQQAGKKKPPIEEHKKPDESDEEEQPTTSFKRSSSDSEDESTARVGFGGAQNTSEMGGDIAGIRNRNSFNPQFMNRGVGTWEKHTKGIGAKLLLQMGFQPGRGLGKDLQGISAPVEAHLRKGRGAIGAYGPEKKSSLAQPDIIMPSEETSKQDPKESKWKKDISKKTRYYYRSADDVIEKGKKPGVFKNANNLSELSKVKVIDMTGPQQRVLSGYHALSGLKTPTGVENYEDVLRKKCTNFALPEIQHNLDILVDMCEQDIIRIDRSTHYNQDRIVSLEQEEQGLKKLLIKEDADMKNLQDVLDIVNRLVDPASGLSLGQVATSFKALQRDHYEEYCQYELSELAPGLVGPLLTSALANWQPLTQPTLYLDVFRQWRELLTPTQRGTIEGNSMGIQPYDSLLWHTWVPVIRACVR